jgi:hypothetical protein
VVERNLCEQFKEHLYPLSTVGRRQACVKRLLLLEDCLLDG